MKTSTEYVNDLIQRRRQNKQCRYCGTAENVEKIKLNYLCIKCRERGKAYVKKCEDNQRAKRKTLSNFDWVDDTLLEIKRIRARLFRNLELS